VACVRLMDDVTPDSDVPLVRVVVLNFDGGDMTLDCLDSVLATDWPEHRLDVVMVDNGSLDDVVQRIAASDRARRVRVLEPLANLGFAAGCNLGIRLPGDHDFVALINNDATVSPQWLKAMVGAAGADERIGAVNAKLLFADRYHGIELEAEEATHLVKGETRLLGVRVSGVRLDGERVDDRLAFDEGFYAGESAVMADGEEIARWSSRRGALRIAAENGARPRQISVRLSCLVPRTVTLRSDVDERRVTVDTSPVWVDVTIPPEPFDVVNNVGSNLFRGGFGGDRGFLEIDRGQYDEPADVFAWCGGAVLLRRAYLDDVGLFDERLFLYYEDTDLSWRGRLHGWRYVYEPNAVVRHRHAASSGGATSPMFRFYTERNRLLVLAKNAPARLALRSGLGEVRRLVATTVRNYLIRPLTLRLPRPPEVRHRRAVTLAYLRALPSMLRSRRSAKRSVSRESLMAWEVDKWAA
ncbi:MAG TPA: glycosyltransferase family 2 protein, partial [Ilumatobacteraceae bacterium]